MKWAALIVVACVAAAGGRYLVNHPRHTRPYTATVNSVFVTVDPSRTPHYFLKVGDDFATAKPVEVSHDEFEQARVGEPWLVK